LLQGEAQIQAAPAGQFGGDEEITGESRGSLRGSEEEDGLPQGLGESPGQKGAPSGILDQNEGSVHRVPLALREKGPFGRVLPPPLGAREPPEGSLSRLESDSGRPRRKVRIFAP
jgi:hypothetical protein